MKKNNPNNTINVKLANKKEQAPKQVGSDQGSLEFNWEFPKQDFLNASLGTDNIEQSAIDSNKRQVEQTLKEYLADDFEMSANDEDESTQKLVNNKRKIRKVHLLKRILVPVILALVIGNLIGFLVLYLINSSDPIVPTDADVDMPVSGSAEETMTPYSKDLHVSLIQAGVFAGEDTLENLKTSLQVKYATQKFVFDEKYYLFVGVVNSLDNAKKIAANITDEQQAFYWKEVMFDGESKAIFSEGQKDKISETKEKFLEMTSILGTMKLSQRDPETKFQLLELDNMGEAMGLLEKYNECVKALEKYRSSQSADDMKNFEQSLLDYVSIYHEL